uniref:DUF834 domain-containing protein n=1 Tax=Oryza nivara TaxID=4536 RepID=A0A0E0GM16_ORYNI
MRVETAAADGDPGSLSSRTAVEMRVETATTAPTSGGGYGVGAERRRPRRERWQARGEPEVVGGTDEAGEELTVDNEERGMKDLARRKRQKKANMIMGHEWAA